MTGLGNIGTEKEETGQTKVIQQAEEGRRNSRAGGNRQLRTQQQQSTARVAKA